MSIDCIEYASSAGNSFLPSDSPVPQVIFYQAGVGTDNNFYSEYIDGTSPCSVLNTIIMSVHLIRCHRFLACIQSSGSLCIHRQVRQRVSSSKLITDLSTVTTIQGMRFVSQSLFLSRPHMNTLNLDIPLWIFTRCIHCTHDCGPHCTLYPLLLYIPPIPFITGRDWCTR